MGSSRFARRREPRAQEAHAPSTDSTSGTPEGRRGPVASRRTNAAGANDADTAAESLPEEVVAVHEHGDAAWDAFLARYSTFLLGCLRRMTRDYDERMEIYAHVCSRLFEGDCRRIKQFRGRGSAGPCKFTTWLAAVTFNVAREWIRNSRGRRRLLRRVQQLPEEHRLVFRYRYWEGFELAEVGELLASNHAIRLDRRELDRVMADVQCVLGSEHIWRLAAGTRWRSGWLSVEGRTADETDQPIDLVAEGNGLETELVREHAAAAFRELFDGLPAEESAALRLRYAHGMPAHVIAKTLGVTNHKRVYELQARGLERLASALRARGVTFTDFGPQPGGLDLLDP